MSFWSKIVQLFAPVISSLMVTVIPVPESIKYMLMASITSVLNLISENFVMSCTIPSRNLFAMSDRKKNWKHVSLLFVMDESFLKTVSFLQSQKNAPFIRYIREDGYDLAISSDIWYDKSLDVKLQIICGNPQAKNTKEMMDSVHVVISAKVERNVSFLLEMIDRQPFSVFHKQTNAEKDELIVRKQWKEFPTQSYGNDLYNNLLKKYLRIQSGTEEDFNHEAQKYLVAVECSSFDNNSYRHILPIDGVTFVTEQFGTITIRHIWDFVSDRHDSEVLKYMSLLVKSNLGIAKAKSFLYSLASSQLSEEGFSVDRLTFTETLEGNTKTKKFEWESKQIVSHAGDRNLSFYHSVVNEKVFKPIDSFWTHREKFLRYGLFAKFGFVLYGVPGTGKSTIPMAVAKSCCLSFYDVNLSLIGNAEEFGRAVKECKGVIVLNDFEKSPFAASLLQCLRSVNNNNVTHEKKEACDASSFFNWIDNCGTTNDCILFMTANSLELLQKINEQSNGSLFRSGRFETLVLVEPCDEYQFFQTFSLMFPLHEITKNEQKKLRSILDKKKLTIADVKKCFLASEFDPHKFIANLDTFAFI